VRIRDGTITGMAHLSPVGFASSVSDSFNDNNNDYDNGHVAQGNQRSYLQQRQQGHQLQPPNHTHQNHNILTCDSRGCLRVWNFYQHEPNTAVLSINVSKVALYCIAVSASGRYIATGGKDRTVYVCEVVQSSSQSPEYSLELVSACHGHTGSIKSLSFSSDERSIVSVGEDGSLCVWDMGV
jgi:WD40 repeat protein